MIVGRFAPSPTGPLHFGSLVAAVGSWLFARSAGGRWLVRIEDLDTARVIPGSAEEILGALRLYGLEWDGDVVWQSARTNLYADALAVLGAKGLAYDCACSRADVKRSASAQYEDEPVYPGTCRGGLDGRAARSTRFRTNEIPIDFSDLIRGPIRQHAGGDFVLKRADGPFAYQLAVVVDDAAEGVNQVIRGGDLLGSTGRQIALQQALGSSTPRYGHLPLVVNAEGAKVGKRDGALPLPLLDPTLVRRTLAEALSVLGVHTEEAEPAEMLASARALFGSARLTGRATVVHNPAKQA